MKEKFVFGDSLTVYADKNLCFDELSTLTWGFCGKNIKCEIKEGNDNEIRIGDADIINLDNGDEYTLNITETGVAVKGKDRNGLMRGYMSFLMSIVQKSPFDNKPVFNSTGTSVHGKFLTGNRMAHICIFPETTFVMFRKLVRLCAVLQYTHIIIEFWGMLKYDCLKELSWPSGFEKSQVKEIIEEAKNLGIIPVPMFNHFGHASQSRGLNGKHVVLDQNPSLAYLFTPDGWAWDIEREETYSLLATIRKELYELFGEGEYIHLGCDEAYIYGHGFTDHKNVAYFFERITNECVSENRTPILWGDMFLCKKELSDEPIKYECNAKTPEDAAIIRNVINKKSIIADWHYDVYDSPWKTSALLNSEGFNIMCCPWFRGQNIRTGVETVKTLGLCGVIQTTWHVLSSHMHMLYDCAKLTGTYFPDNLSYSVGGHIAATLMRKISFEDYSYEESGFAAYQTGTDYRNDV